MTHQDLLRFLSIYLLVCIVIIVIIDLAADQHIRIVARLKWSLLWLFCRYTGIVCAVVLALDTLF